MFKAGFVYKPSHPTIHFIKNDAIFNRRMGDDKKFTLEEAEAKIFADEFEAKSAIDFLIPPPKPNYQLTPVTLNIKTGERKVHTLYQPSV
ncbi:hypothetical protein C9J22_13160 [Photobacterium phosphoreum]|uniref:hypothetical protein n=1 Tax=Photobacterium phosphoreum TaxID=659 RepID=UPI000D1760C1|nr:hypothetical protein [Photobacterium phosphoreum]PSU69821.1 hypothetical protein C9J22_13160 [Photobacterium phosphoreum]